MKSLFDKKNSEMIDILDKASELNYRSKPYDINNVKDLKEMLKIKVQNN